MWVRGESKILTRLGQGLSQSHGNVCGPTPFPPYKMMRWFYGRDVNLKKNPQKLNKPAKGDSIFP